MGSFIVFTPFMTPPEAFKHLQPQVYAPGIVPLSDIQLLEGMADVGREVRHESRHDGLDREMAHGGIPIRSGVAAVVPGYPTGTRPAA